MTGPAAITLVLVGTFSARIPTVGAGRHMIGLTATAAVAGVRAIALARGGVSTGRACHLEAIVMTGPAAITLVLVGTLRARIPTVGAGCNMVDLAGPTAATGVRVITLTRSWTAARRAYHLEAVVRAAPRTTAGVLVSTLGACIPTVGARCD